jgi:hypothetical protein
MDVNTPAQACNETHTTTFSSFIMSRWKTCGYVRDFDTWVRGSNLGLPKENEVLFFKLSIPRQVTLQRPAGWGSCLTKDSTHNRCQRSTGCQDVDLPAELPRAPYYGFIS